MVKKTKVKVEQALPRFPLIPKFSFIEVEGCLGCKVCVKRTSCLFDAYRNRRFDPLSFTDTAETACVSCLRCIQECKKNIITRAGNPEHALMGDSYWRPDLIASLWQQASTGQIPVSGAGYRGPFSGQGFDEMWTDMSEIVRPTRDGIHGREYISTAIELGRKPARLEIDEEGRLVGEPLPLVEIPLPLLLDLPPLPMRGGQARQAMARAARMLGTYAVATVQEAQGPLAGEDHLLLRFDPAVDDLDCLEGRPLVELFDSSHVLEEISRIKERYPNILASIRLPLDEYAVGRASMLADWGTDIVHLQANHQGRGLGRRSERFVTSLVRQVHLRLVEEGIRDQVTLLVSGGIAMAEHVAKIIICGADGAGVDLALWVALECRLCSSCLERSQCPVDLEGVPVELGAQRIVNLLGSWHGQLIEVLGAMGIREVRRMRGEVGRAMVFEDLERECFGPLFGQRAKEAGGRRGRRRWHEPATRAMEEHIRSTVPTRPSIPSRFRNRIAMFKVVRTSACQACGRCVEVCSQGVHRRGGRVMLSPRSHLCLGAPACQGQHRFCGDECPQGALHVGPDPLWETVGDPRWTADLIAATWVQAETGRPPDQGLEYRVGASGGGFDRIDLVFPDEADQAFGPEDVDLSLPLNHRHDERPQVTLGLPVYGGGMSYGSISLTTMLARARAYSAMGSFTCTGEGGYPEELRAYDDHVITQVATGLFGVREETIQRVRIVEFKYAQGAKPGLGGHLLGDKVTPAVAKIREAVEGSALFSPFPFHSVYSVEDHKKHVDWIKMINPRALVSVKVSTPTDVDMVAVGSYYAGAHIIHIDGGYGGTGAAPDIAKKNIAMPIEYAIPKVHRFLEEEGIRDKVTLIASGGLRSAWDIAKAIALGADGVVLGTAELVALECVRCGRCESGRGCPRGIATTDPELSVTFDQAWASGRLVNLLSSYALQLQAILWRLGLRTVRDLVGRSDLLAHRDYLAHEGVTRRSAAG